MAPYLDALIGKLLALLQRGRRNVQEGALTALAAVADTAEVWGGQGLVLRVCKCGGCRRVPSPRWQLWQTRQRYGGL